MDWDALAAWVSRYGYKVAECEAEELAIADAAKRLREWEKQDREEAIAKPHTPYHPTRPDLEASASRSLENL